MKAFAIFLIASLLSMSYLNAQELFSGFGKKGPYAKVVREFEKVTIPQLSITYKTYVETKVVEKEGRLSAMANTFDAASKGGTYVGKSSSAMTVTILDVPMELADFQSLTNDFQKILEEELSNAGVPLVRLEDFAQTKMYAKWADKYSNKTENKGKKNDDENVGKGDIRMFPYQSLFVFDEKSLVLGGGVPFITMVRNTIKETGAAILLQNFDINFSVVDVDVDLAAGTKRTVTSATTEVFPRMNISRNTFNILGKNGPASAHAEITQEYKAEKEYGARIYQDPEKGKKLLEKMFSLKGATIEFEPFIVEMDKETYIAAAKDLFRQYSKDFASVYADVLKGK